MTGNFGPSSRLLQYLPAVYQEPVPPPPNPIAEEPEYKRPFLDEYLLPFEEILLGRRGSAHRAHALEYRVGTLYRLLDPRRTPEEFLPWLAQFAALPEVPGLPVPRYRKLLASIVSWNALRGTRLYLEQLLAICMDVPCQVIDDAPPLQVGRHSTIGRDTWIQGGPPHFFRVVLKFTRADRSHVEQQRALARRVIDFAKPAHTYYLLEVASPRFQVGVHSTIAVDSFL
jgi:phage tail-like protein